MKQRDSPKVLSLKNLKVSIESFEKNQKKEITDDELINLLNKYADQRIQNIKQFSSNEEFCKKEQYDLDIVNVYIPPILSEDATRDLVNVYVSDTRSAFPKLVMQHMAPIMQLVINEAKELGFLVDRKLLARLIKDEINA